MREFPPEPELADLLAKYEESGGVLDYVFLESEAEGSPEQLHRAAALAGMATIDRRLEQWAIRKLFQIWNHPRACRVAKTEPEPCPFESSLLFSET